jgi:capsular polysaccharide biosynthesis protein
METVYVIKDRGYHWMYHWIILMLGGLRNIKESKPLKIYCPFNYFKYNDLCFQQESLDMISEEYVETTPNESNNIVVIDGESLLKPDMVNFETYTFLRSLYLSKCPSFDFTGKRYYLTRKNAGLSNPLNEKISSRHILNEESMFPILLDNGFEIISLEDYSFKDKIKIFNTAGIIMSPNSGGLTLSLFASKRTKL